MRTMIGSCARTVTPSDEAGRPWPPADRPRRLPGYADSRTGLTAARSALGCAPVGPGRALHLKKIGLAAVPAGTVHAGDQPHGRGIDMEALCVQYERVADMRVEDFGDDDELTRPGLHAVKRPAFKARDRKSTRLNSSH